MKSDKLPRQIDLTGMKFGFWLVVEKCPWVSSNGTRVWRCLCKCGNTKYVLSHDLKSGGSKSCGCGKEYFLRIGNTRHGMTYTTEWNTWKGITQRCEDKKSPNYKNYGGRGIKICSGWRNSFESFYKDMGIKPKPKLTIERVENNGQI